MKCSFSSDRYEYIIVGMSPPSQPTHSNHLPDWQVAKTLIWMPGDTVLICTSMGGKPSTVSPANDQIYNDMMAIQSLLCLLRNQDERKTKQKRRNANMERPVLSPRPMWHEPQPKKKLACGLPCDSCFHPYFLFFFFKSLSLSSLARACLFWLSLLKVETWSYRKASCVYIQPLLLVEYLSFFLSHGRFSQFCTFYTCFDTVFVIIFIGDELASHCNLSIPCSYW